MHPAQQEWQEPQPDWQQIQQIYEQEQWEADNPEEAKYYKEIAGILINQTNLDEV